MPDTSPLFWSIADLISAYKARELSPVEVTREALQRIERHDPELNAFLSITRDTAMEQARHAEEVYMRGEPETPYLLGVPLAIKDLFFMKGSVTTLGSLIYRDRVASHDSGSVRRLRRSGGILLGKTNTAEFGQSATTDNRLRDACRNPWDALRTSGGSSGGTAAAVAAGLATAGLGSDGGGSIRIPAAFCGLFGFKPTVGLCLDEGGFEAMTDVVCPGPLTRTVADGRIMLSVLADRPFARQEVKTPLRVAWCPRPEGRPVDPVMLEAITASLGLLQSLGHDVSERELQVEGWRDIFRVLVLADEKKARADLLRTHASQLTEYELRTLEAAQSITETEIADSYELIADYRQRISLLFEKFDIIATPTTAVPAFPVTRRPQEIDGQRVDSLWGAFPFCVPYNVAGCPAVSLPVGMADGLPAGLQLVAPVGHDWRLMDLSQDLEEAIGFDLSPLIRRWGGGTFSEVSA
jgi:aspartyl-tRNA(Asn)/glutamyl-tRNA(Gln) amidotransferase subunit A